MGVYEAGMKAGGGAKRKTAPQRTQINFFALLGVEGSFQLPLSAGAVKMSALFLWWNRLAGR